MKLLLGEICPLAFLLWLRLRIGGYFVLFLKDKAFHNVMFGESKNLFCFSKHLPLNSKIKINLIAEGVF